jgi:extracellular elastinolytic metalloproteinase
LPRSGKSARPPVAPGTRQRHDKATVRNQATTQLFWFVNTFQDHLETTPIGFTHPARGFEFDDADGPGGAAGSDPVIAESDNLDPTNSATLRDSTNNASMSTPVDGSPPWLRTYLYTDASLNAADAADVVLHEYTHGLTNRLIGTRAGLEADQSRAPVEAWRPTSRARRARPGATGTRSTTSARSS